MRAETARGRASVRRVQEFDGNPLREPFTSLTKIGCAMATGAKPLKQAEGSEIGRKECVQAIPVRHEQPSQRFSLSFWNNRSGQWHRAAIKQVGSIQFSIRAQSICDVPVQKDSGSGKPIGSSTQKFRKGDLKPDFGDR